MYDKMHCLVGSKIGLSASVLLLSILLLFIGSCQNENVSVVVYAAASLSDVMTAVGEQYEDSTGTEVVFNFAGSNVLARQIVAAGGADVFLSANEQWMDYARENGRIVPETRISLLSNSLVVIANSSAEMNMQAPQDLCRYNVKFLALGNPDAVPAGRYAREWLMSVKCGDRSAWELLEGKISPAPDVRAAMGLVEAAGDIIGIVYQTDAAMSDRVKVLYNVPDSQGPEIRYSAARLQDAHNPEQADSFLAYIRSEQAADIFHQYGFKTLTD